MILNYFYSFVIQSVAPDFDVECNFFALYSCDIKDCIDNVLNDVSLMLSCCKLKYFWNLNT